MIPSEPRFQLGDHVVVIVDENNRTPRQGTIRSIIWHHDQAQWHYYLQGDKGHKISKRYTVDALKERVPPPGGG